MQSYSVWIKLRLGALGLAGLFLQEFRSLYQLLRTSTLRALRVVIVIRRKVKRQYFTNYYLISPVKKESRKIYLRQYKTYNTLIINYKIYVNSKISQLLGKLCPGYYYIY